MSMTAIASNQNIESARHTVASLVSESIEQFEEMTDAVLDSSSDDGPLPCSGASVSLAKLIWQLRRLFALEEQVGRADSALEERLAMAEFIAEEDRLLRELDRISELVNSPPCSPTTWLDMEMALRKFSRQLAEHQHNKACH